MTDNSPDSTTWRKCSSCKKSISFGARYYVCSVSTCNGQRTGYVFCSVGCWESHVPGARHRDAAAVEKIAPTREAALRELQSQASSTSSAVAAGTTPASGAVAARPPSRVFASTAPARTTVGSSPSVSSAAPRETLIIASRLKEFIDAQSGGYNTSQSVIDALSEHVRLVCVRAIENARSEGRKTVMDRDFEFLKQR